MRFLLGYWVGSRWLRPRRASQTRDVEYVLQWAVAAVIWIICIAVVVLLA